VQLNHVLAGRRPQDAAQLRGPEIEAAPLLLEVAVLIVDGMRALLRVSDHGERCRGSAAPTDWCAWSAQVMDHPGCGDRVPYQIGDKLLGLATSRVVMSVIGRARHGCKNSRRTSLSTSAALRCDLIRANQILATAPNVTQRHIGTG
jgi:hypothetical protein